MTEKQKIRHIVRIGSTDLEGNKAINVALTKIKGVGSMYAHMLCRLSDIDLDTKAGVLDSNQIKRIEIIMENPDDNGVPAWMRNRRRDLETGEDIHIMTSDLQFTKQQDIRRLQKIRSYRGSRHARGLPVRGQRTKGNFRKNRGKAVGVKRKSGAKSGRV